MAIQLGSVLSSLGGALGSGMAQPIEEGLNRLSQEKMMLLQQKYADAANERAAQRQYQYTQAAKAAERERFVAGAEPYMGKEVASFLGNLSPQERSKLYPSIGALYQLQGENAPSDISTARQPAQRLRGNANVMQELFTSPAEKRQREMLDIQRASLEIKKEAEKRQRDALELQKKGLEFKKGRATQEEKLSAFKETKPERKEILSGARAARESVARLERMEELNKNGKLSSPAYLEFLKKAGLDIPALTSPDTQEFRKLEADFLREARSIFGSRISNYEVNAFLRAIPSSMQSREGRERVIHNLKTFYQASKERADTMSSIIKENKGVPPLDLMDQVESKSSGRIDKLMRDFKEGLSGKTFDSLPSASEFKGKKIVDEDTGKVLVSDGKEWKEV
jgi:hypothetical protein